MHCPQQLPRNRNPGRKRAAGSGPGFYIGMEAVRYVGGLIAVTSRPGAEFVITLPNQLPAVPAEPAAQLHTKDAASV